MSFGGRVPLTYLEGNEDVGEGLTICVVEVHCEFVGGHGSHDCFKHERDSPCDNRRIHDSKV